MSRTAFTLARYSRLVALRVIGLHKTPLFSESLPQYQLDLEESA